METRSTDLPSTSLLIHPVIGKAASRGVTPGENSNARWGDRARIMHSISYASPPGQWAGARWRRVCRLAHHPFRKTDALAYRKTVRVSAGRHLGESYSLPSCRTPTLDCTDFHTSDHDWSGGSFVRLRRSERSLAWFRKSNVHDRSERGTHYIVTESGVGEMTSKNEIVVADRAEALTRAVHLAV